MEQDRDLREPAAGIESAAAGEGDDNVGIGGGDGFDERILAVGQREGAVGAFAFGGVIEADGGDHHIRLRGVLLHLERDHVRFIDESEAEADAGEGGLVIGDNGDGLAVA